MFEQYDAGKQERQNSWDARVRDAEYAASIPKRMAPWDVESTLRLARRGGNEAMDARKGELLNAQSERMSKVFPIGSVITFSYRADPNAPKAYRVERHYVDENKKSEGPRLPEGALRMRLVPVDREGEALDLDADKLEKGSDSRLWSLDLPGESKERRAA